MPRFRFTVRGMMLTVAIAAVILVVENEIAHWAVGVVSEGDGKGGTVYIRGEAIMVWAGVHVATVPPLLLIGAVTYLAFRSLWNPGFVLHFPPSPTRPRPQ